MAVMHSIYRESGTVRVDRNICRLCSACVRICPEEVLYESDGSARARDDAPFGCIACGHCMMV